LGDGGERVMVVIWARTGEIKAKAHAVERRSRSIGFKRGGKLAKSFRTVGKAAYSKVINNSE
jgi:hypothetical protein